MFGRCHYCGLVKATPYKVTEVDGDQVTEFVMCRKCSVHYFDNGKPELDLTHVTTPEQLLTVLADVQVKATTCKCGTSLAEFDQFGRFGCAECYDFFRDIMQRLVYPYHGATQHVGKVPRRQMAKKTPLSQEEQISLLRLRLAQAIELEKYEEASELHKQLKSLKADPPPS